MLLTPGEGKKKGAVKCPIRQQKQGKKAVGLMGYFCFDEWVLF